MFKITDNALKSIKEFFEKELFILFGEQECKSLFKLACEGILNTPYSKPIDYEIRLSESEVLQFFNLIKRLKNNEPIQHILTYAFFYDLKLKVNKDVLIPRQETEELVHLAIQFLKQNETATVLDLCTGSGCIALALKKNYPKANVQALELSNAALSIAQENALELNLAITFNQLDVLDLNTLKTKYQANSVDLVISNPPYIHPDESTKMEQNVLKYEPKMALFAPASDVLVFYKKITEFAEYVLKKGGLLLFEINEHYGTELLELLSHSTLHNTKLINDINGKQRILSATT